MTFGVVCGLIGLVVFLCWEGQTSDYGYVAGFFGASTCVIAIGMYIVKNPNRQIQKLRAILMYSPELIIWSYELRKSVNGIENGVYVVMKARGHDEFSIQQRALLNGDCEAFLQLLAYLNPDMRIGYSDASKKSHRENQL